MFPHASCEVFQRSFFTEYLRVTTFKFNPWWFGQLMTHFKRVDMPCVSNSLSSQVNLYVPVVTTSNANAANEALTIRRMCTALQKYARPCMVDV